MSRYEVRGVKFHKGHEGEPLAQCSLYRDGVKVASYSDGDWGGESDFSWFDGKAPKVPVATKGYDGNPVTLSCTPEEAALWGHIRGMTWNDGKMDMTPVIFVSDLIQACDAENWCKRQCKAKTLFRVKGDPKDSWRTIKAVYSAQVRDFITKKYGEQVEEILNERFGKLAA